MNSEQCCVDGGCRLPGCDKWRKGLKDEVQVMVQEQVCVQVQVQVKVINIRA